MKIFITGATGFVGSHLADLLHEEGHTVYSLVRNLAKAKEFNVKGTLIKGSLSPLKRHEWIEQLPMDLDAVVHTAGIVHSFNTKDFFSINTESTRQLIEDLAPKYSDLKFVMISSLAAAGPSESFQTERMRPVPVSEYGRSKLLAEMIVKNETPADWSNVIIRPPMVIGPRDPAVLDVFKMVKNGIVPSVGSKGADKIYSFIGVFDLIETIKLSLEKDIEDTEIFYSAYPDAIKFKELLKVIALELEKKTPFLIPLPLAAVKLATKIISLSKPGNIRLTPDKIHEIAPKAWTCSGDKATQNLGQKYQWDLQRIIKTTLLDYQKRGWI